VTETEALAPLFEIRLTDVLDILLVTALVYTTLVWIRRAQAALVAMGILILGALYVTARAVGLQMTAWIFQGFFAIFLIIVVVIFQEELRQFFERVAVLSLWRGRSKTSRPVGTEVADVLVRCATDFARERIGALIVIPGSQPIARHVQGGVRLDGELSVPLVKSIFDPHSPGHDGAAIIERDRLTRFAVHLPLSRNFTQLTGMGTRHSAALGLAELTDALCVVVSEERGQVSVAHDGRLWTLAEAHELGGVLQRALAAGQPAADGWRLWEDVVRKNWVEKLASLFLVAGLWYLSVPGARPTQRTFGIPVRVINLPVAFHLETVTPPKVDATFQGPARLFYLFDRRRVEITVDAALAKDGRRTFTIGEQNVRYPKELTLHELRPSRVRISVQKEEPKDKDTGANGADGSAS